MNKIFQTITGIIFFASVASASVDLDPFKISSSSKSKNAHTGRTEESNFHHYFSDNVFVFSVYESCVGGVNALIIDAKNRNCSLRIKDPSITAIRNAAMVRKNFKVACSSKSKNENAELASVTIYKPKDLSLFDEPKNAFGSSRRYYVTFDDYGDRIKIRKNQYNQLVVARLQAEAQNSLLSIDVHQMVFNSDSVKPFITIVAKKK